MYFGRLSSASRSDLPLSSMVCVRYTDAMPYNVIKLLRDGGCAAAIANKAESKRSTAKSW